MHSPIKFIILITLLILTAWIYFNTVITRKWRNKAPEEYNSWKLGVFYYNPLDKRIFIPKRTALGIDEPVIAGRAVWIRIRISTPSYSHRFWTGL